MVQKSVHRLLPALLLLHARHHYTQHRISRRSLKIFPRSAFCIIYLSLYYPSVPSPLYLAECTACPVPFAQLVLPIVLASHSFGLRCTPAYVLRFRCIDLVPRRAFSTAVSQPFFKMPTLPFSLSSLKTDSYRAEKQEPIKATKANHLCVLVHG